MQVACFNSFCLFHYCYCGTSLKRYMSRAHVNNTSQIIPTPRRPVLQVSITFLNAEHCIGAKYMYHAMSRIVLELSTCTKQSLTNPLPSLRRMLYHFSHVVFYLFQTIGKKEPNQNRIASFQNVFAIFKKVALRLKPGETPNTSAS